MKKIRIYLIEDNTLFCEGIVAITKQTPDIEIYASSTVRDEIADAKDWNPDIILLDTGLSHRNSLELISEFRKELPDSRIIILDLIPTQVDMIEYVKSGVSGFILKNATMEDFLRTIRSVAAGEKVLPPSMTGSLFMQIAEFAIRNGKAITDEAVRMTRREREVIGLIGEGLTNKEIAQRLHIATYTVKSHVHNILEKLALRTRLQIAAYALNKNKR